MPSFLRRAGIQSFEFVLDPGFRRGAGNGGMSESVISNDPVPNFKPTRRQGAK